MFVWISSFCLKFYTYFSCIMFFCTMVRMILVQILFCCFLWFIKYRSLDNINIKSCCMHPSATRGFSPSPMFLNWSVLLHLGVFYSFCGFKWIGVWRLQFIHSTINGHLNCFLFPIRTLLLWTFFVIFFWCICVRVSLRWEYTHLKLYWMILILLSFLY